MDPTATTNLRNQQYNRHTSNIIQIQVEIRKAGHARNGRRERTFAYDHIVTKKHKISSSIPFMRFPDMLTKTRLFELTSNDGMVSINIV